MKYVYLALLLMALTPLASADDSMLLAGLAPVTAFPPQLALPAEWLDPLRQMSADAGSGTHERARCVYLQASDQAPDTVKDAIDAYGVAMHVDKKGELAAAKVVAAKLATVGEGPALSLGTLQGGSESSIPTICMGTTVGDIHTHPQKLATVAVELPSDVDIASLLHSGEPMAVVVSGQRMCVSLNGSRRVPDSDVLIQARYGAEAFADARGSAAVDGAAHGVARLLEHYGGALYCGPIGQVLPRVAPTPPVAGDGLVLLEAKAWIMALKYTGRDNWPALDFPFVPVADPAFLGYLPHVLSTAGTAALAQWQARHGDGAALLELLVADLGVAGETSWSNGFMMPDPREPLATGPYSSFVCDEQSCALQVLKGNDPFSDMSARYIEEYWMDGALRVNPAPTTSSLSVSQRAALQAKATLLATKWRDHPEWPPVRFDFTPVLDESFWKYVKAVWPAAQQGALAAVDASGDATALSSLIRKTFVAPAQSWGVLDGVPDSGGNTYVFNCADDDCTLAPVVRDAVFNGGQAAYSRASYTVAGGDMLLDSKGVEAIAHITYKDGSHYVGDYVQDGADVKKSGHGRLTTKAYTLDAQFADNEARGKGKIQLPGSHAWHPVQAHGQGLEVDNRIVPAPADVW